MFAALICLVLPTASRSWALTLEDVVAKIESNYKNIAAFKGNFKQKATLKTLNKVQESLGKLFYKKPNKFKWQYTNPTGQEITSDGKTLWIYLPENKQIYIYELADNQGIGNEGQIPGNFLGNLGDLGRDFNVKWGTPLARDAQGNYIIELEPKSPVANIHDILLVIPRDITTNPSSAFPVIASTVRDAYGNTTNIEFTNIEILETLDWTVKAKKKTGGLPDSIFTYTPPANVEIIKPPQ
ncbi:MAG: outer rane lipoprotein carrier/sorting protein LolA, partial [Deltaproteobacteria bacterium]|nr:outer rane lipoprotein carrier/sorting protein LolA [Deltaproteobacteria bacterium]